MLPPVWSSDPQSATIARFCRAVRPHMATATSSPAKVKLTSNQIRGFWAAWAGWALDGLGSFIYALVLVPALRELLPKSGIPVNPGNTGFYGGLLFAIFLMGWGSALVWGPIADRFGRARTLFLTILCYAIFALLCAFAHNIWELAAYRFMAGLGIGGEWAMGGTFVAEEWPEAASQDRRRPNAHRLLFRILLAAIANHFVGRGLRLAGDVHHRRCPVDSGGLSDVGRHRARSLEGAKGTGFHAPRFRLPRRRYFSLASAAEPSSTRCAFWCPSSACGPARSTFPLR